MAKKDTQGKASAAKQADATPEETQEEREAAAQEIEEQAQAEQSAAEQRDAAMERRADQRKSYEGDEPPSQVTKGDDTAYSQDRLIADAEGFLGFPSHVVAGALHGNTEPYLTIQEAKAEIDAFLNREVTTA